MSKFYLVDTKTGEIKDEMAGAYEQAFAEWFDEVVGSDYIRIIEV